VTAKERREGALIAVDGVDGAAVKAAARALLPAIPAAGRARVSRWASSGLFADLMIAPQEAGSPSARTLLLFYAADVAFRLRWQIRPAIDEGKVVIAAPYVATAIAFGRAAGLPAAWLDDLFTFALPPSETRFVGEMPRRASAKRSGFVDFGIRCLDGNPNGTMRRELVTRMRAYLKASARR